MSSLQQFVFADAIVLKFAPRLEKKFPNISNSSQVNCLERYTEITLEKMTNSFPEQLLK